MILARCLVLACALGSVAARSAEIRVSATRLHEKGGRLAWALFSDAKNFPSGRESAVQKGLIEIPTAAESLSFEIRDVEAGEYAVALFQDFDGDAKLKKNFLGIPREPIGFSRDPRVRLGPPSFDSARFKVAGEGPLLLEIRMIRD